MNQREERVLTERIQAESAEVARLMLELDGVLERAMQIRAEMKLGIARIETLQSTMASD